LFPESPRLHRVSGVKAALAVDIGGTKLEVGLVDDAGEVLIRRRASTVDPMPESADDLFQRLAALIQEVLAEQVARPVVCGVGTGGPMEPFGETVSPLNIAAWDRFPLRRRIVDLLGELGVEVEVHIDNDAKALALGEGWVGAAMGVMNFMAMVVSTGVGGGIVLGGWLLDGAGGNAGHIGHVVVNPGGRLHAGIQGTLEGEASGTAIEALAGKPAADAGLEWRLRTGVLVGRAAGGVANLLDLDLILVAGSVALGYGATFFDAAQSELDRVARLDFSRGARILPAGLGSDGPLIGAAAVGLRGMGHRLGVIKPPGGTSPPV